ncbi:hypothetical protein X975_04809, partial [Stegodyphus mimosarum]
TSQICSNVLPSRQYKSLLHVVTRRLNCTGTSFHQWISLMSHSDCILLEATSLFVQYAVLLKTCSLKSVV